jgi:hypothetical protein
LNYAYALIAVVLFGSGFYLGTLPGRATLDHTLAAQATQTAKAVQAEAAAAQIEQNRLNAVIAKYEAIKDIPDPVIPGLGGRLYKYIYASCPVPKASPDTTGTVIPAQEPRSDVRTGQALQAVFDACSADARQLSALIDAWPK